MFGVLNEAVVGKFFILFGLLNNRIPTNKGIVRATSRIVTPVNQSISLSVRISKLSDEEFFQIECKQYDRSSALVPSSTRRRSGWSMSLLQRLNTDAAPCDVAVVEHGDDR